MPTELSLKVRRAQRRAIYAGTLRGCQRFGRYLGNGVFAVPKEKIILVPDESDLPLVATYVAKRILRRAHDANAMLSWSQCIDAAHRVLLVKYAVA